MYIWQLSHHSSFYASLVTGLLNEIRRREVMNNISPVIYILTIDPGSHLASKWL